MTRSDAVVSVQNLRKKYGDLIALDGVTFDIQRGETFALLGPNGAGKSTTIEILEGYRDRSSGDARVLGIDPHQGGVAWKARLGIVLQNTGESGNVTVREQLNHFAGFYPNPRPVDEVIAAVGLEQKGTTILLTTHYLDEAAQLGDRAGVIVSGTLIDIGRIDEIGGADARIPFVRWHESGQVRETRTTEPGIVVAELVRTLGREPDGLEIIRPSLEDIYLTLVSQHQGPRDLEQVS